MTVDELENARHNADMIVCGYAFTRMADSNVLVLQLGVPFHALVMSCEGDVLETTMDDVELNIVKDYWIRNRKHMEESYA